MMELQPPPAATFAWTQAQAAARARAPSSDPMKLLAGALALTDATVLAATSAGAYLLRHGPGPIPTDVAATTLLAIALTLNGMHLAGAYSRIAASSAAVQVVTVLRVWSLMIVTLVTVGYLTKTSDNFSRAWAITWYVSATVGFALARVAAASQVARWQRSGRLARTVAIVDLCGGAGQHLARRLKRKAGGAVNLVGVFRAERSDGRKDGVNDLLALGQRFRMDEVVVVMSGQTDGAHADAVVRKLGTLPANVRVCPDLPDLAVAPREVGMLFGEPMATVYRRPLTGWNRVAKRAEDLVVSVCLLPVVVPVLLVVAALIKLDSPGPVLFRQERLGFNNNVFTVFKLRTMRHGRGPELAVPQAQRNDPRITRLGSILRKTSIDELPQILNVLRGDMSLVGPRPHALAHNVDYAARIDDYLGRHRVQPGITGWAQVNGLRGETETLDKMQRRVEYDLAYIDGWSLRLDVKIMFLTLLHGIVNRNAY